MPSTPGSRCSRPTPGSTATSSPARAPAGTRSSTSGASRSSSPRGLRRRLLHRPHRVAGLATRPRRRRRPVWRRGPTDRRAVTALSSRLVTGRDATGELDVVVLGGGGHVGLPLSPRPRPRAAPGSASSTRDGPKLDRMRHGEMPFLETGADELLARGPAHRPAGARHGRRDDRPDGRRHRRHRARRWTSSSARR